MNTQTNSNPVLAERALIERDSYGFVNTSEVLQAFKNTGWTPVSTSFGRVRKPENQGFQKHLIRLENPAFPAIEGLSNDNNSRPQLVLLNSHDGTSRMAMLWGLIRIACLNGIIAGTGINGVSFVHSKSIVDKLPQGIDYMLNNFQAFADQIRSLQHKTMTSAAVNELTRRAYSARLASVPNVVSVDWTLGNASRYQDNATDAYTVFNRVQERLMRGGIKYVYAKQVRDINNNVTHSREVTTRTRKIGSVASQIKLNQLVYDAAIELAA